mgnify:CR=1 FL=1
MNEKTFINPEGGGQPNKKIEFESSESDYEQVKILQTIPLMSLILFIGTLLVLFELYLIKKRGDIWC